MKYLKLFAVIGVIVLLVGSIAAISYVKFNKDPEEQKPFYVGVTYCGSSVQEAKELIDKVKNYINLFILQSGPLAINTVAIEEIGDYACAANLSYAILGSKDLTYYIKTYVNGFKERWEDQFVGIYYSDEPGGKMLDSGEIILRPTMENATTIKRTANGEITVEYHDISLFRTYYPDGRVTSEEAQSTEIIEREIDSLPEEKKHVNGTIFSASKSLNYTIDYYPNGTITIEEATNEYTHWSIKENDYQTGYVIDREKYNVNFYTSENITKCPYQILSYEEILKRKPIQTIDEVAEVFVSVNKQRLEAINKDKLQEEKILVFTADYCFYWWDYKSGYDVILAELGWNHTVAQDIGLVRGAANLQGKSWGTIITWKYTHPPFLTSGEEMFEQMKTSYQTGAEYVLIFNYSEDPTNPNTLQEEHFQALERFWNDVVQNSKVKHGSIKANAVLVLPQNYGWGMRHPNDSIWGIWQPDDTSQQIWNQLQNKLDKHGLKLDIVHEDSDYPVAGKYSNIYYWNQK